MGVSTDAILAWGYCWDDECALFDIVHDVSGGEFDDDEIDFWYENIETKVPKGVMLATHCSHEYPIPFICIKKSHHLAWRGEHTRVSQHLLNVDVITYAKWKKMLDDFLDEMGIKRPYDEPGWFICLHWV